jgi:hypothetical protein
MDDKNKKKHYQEFKEKLRKWSTKKSITYYGNETGSFDWGSRESKSNTDNPMIFGLEYNSTLVNEEGCHINFWIPKAIKGKPRKKLLKKALQEASFLFDIVSYGYSLYTQTVLEGEALCFNNVNNAKLTITHKYNE